MNIKGLKDEDFVNYKKPSMFIIFPNCTFKCDKENGCSLCQNSHLAQQPNIDIDYEDIIKRYKANPISKAIVCGGLEPFDEFDDLWSLVRILRYVYNIDDDFVVYTGYTEEEITTNPYWSLILEESNVIIKYGRFRPNEEEHFDEILGVKLSSNNQYAKRYNYEQS